MAKKRIRRVSISFSENKFRRMGSLMDFLSESQVVFETLYLIFNETEEGAGESRELPSSSDSL